jgi:hypothetical protein
VFSQQEALRRLLLSVAVVVADRLAAREDLK